MNKQFTRRKRTEGTPPFPLRDDPVVTVISGVQLLGNHYKSADIIPPDVWKRVPAKNQAALISLETVTLNGDTTICKAESGIHDKRRATLKGITDETEVLSRIRSERDALAIEVDALEQVQRANALADYKAGRSSDSSPELDKARSRLVSLNDAETQSTAEIARLTELSDTLAGSAELARAVSIAKKHVEVTCPALEAGIQALVPIFMEYKAEATQVHYLTHETGNQVTSQWRLESLIQEKLYFRALPRGQRVPDLADIDRRIFSMVIAQAMKKLGISGEDIGMEQEIESEVEEQEEG